MSERSRKALDLLLAALLGLAGHAAWAEYGTAQRLAVLDVRLGRVEQILGTLTKVVLVKP